MSNTNDTFLWVALVCQDLQKKLALFPPGLDSLYERMLQQICESDDADICLRVLAVVTVLYRPVTVAELTALVEQLDNFVNDLDLVREIISLCGSFLTLRDDTVYFVHQSAKDFLLGKAFNKVFPYRNELVHQDIFTKSLTVLYKTLRRDMYKLQAPGCSVENVKLPVLDPLIVSRYPCVSKPKLLANDDRNSQTRGIVDEFSRTKYLNWLEGLSLCKSPGRGVI